MSFTIAESEQKRLSVPDLAEALEPVSSAVPPPDRQSAQAANSSAAHEPFLTDTETPSDSLLTQRNVAIAVAGLGVVGLGAGVFFDFRRRDANERGAAICRSGENCTSEEAREIQTLEGQSKTARTREYIAFGAGAALCTAGVVLFMTAGDGELSGMVAPFSVSDVSGIPRGGGLRLNHSW